MNIEVFLAILVGLGIGALIVLAIDGYTMGQRVKSAKGERNQAHHDLQKTKADLQKANKNLITAQSEVASLKEDLSKRDQELDEKVSLAAHQQHQLDDANAQLDSLNSNLNRVNEHLDELRQENKSIATQLHNAQTDSESLRENLHRTENELETAQAEKQDACQRLAVTDVEMRHLKEDLEQANSLAERATILATEKESLTSQLHQSEQQVAELRAQVNSVLSQLTETQFLRRRLLDTDEKLKTAESQIDHLQSKLKMLQAQMAYTGKNQLQIIKGIGPVYAKKMNEKGIYTLQDLARTDPDELADSINLKPWQSAEPAGWIEEARLLSIQFGEE